MIYEVIIDVPAFREIVTLAADSEEEAKSMTANWLAGTLTGARAKAIDAAFYLR
jgi:hypothetical protein